jgi:hypothetical protein
MNLGLDLGLDLGLSKGLDNLSGPFFANEPDARHLLTKSAGFLLAQVGIFIHSSFSALRHTMWHYRALWCAVEHCGALWSTVVHCGVLW